MRVDVNIVDTCFGDANEAKAGRIHGGDNISRSAAEPSGGPSPLKPKPRSWRAGRSSVCLTAAPRYDVREGDCRARASQQQRNQPPTKRRSCALARATSDCDANLVELRQISWRSARTCCGHFRTREPRSSQPCPVHPNRHSSAIRSRYLSLATRRVVDDLTSHHRGRFFWPKYALRRCLCAYWRAD